MNKVLLIGRLANDIEIQETSNYTKYTRFRLAVKRQYVTKDSEDTDFINIVAWRSQAEFIEKYLVKGSLVLVEGRLTTSIYNDNEGKKVMGYSVAADRVQGLESKAYLQAREISKTQEMKMQEIPVSTSEVKLSEDVTQTTNPTNDDVPWDIDF